MVFSSGRPIELRSVEITAKMRILQICSANYFGGGERYLADLSSMLVAKGHEVFAAMRPGSPLAGRLAAVPQTSIKYFSMRNAVDLFSAAGISNFAKEIGADLIHAHLARDYTLAAAASMLAGVPYVVTRHVLFPLGRAHRRLLSLVSGVIAPSKAVFDSLVASQIFPDDRIHLIRYAADRKRFASVSKRSNRAFTIGSAARLTHNKGHDILARAARLVLDLRPDVRFIVAGEDPSDLTERREIELLIEDLGLGGKFELLGKTEDIPQFLSELDLYVSASRVESFGLSIVEAMMAGVPVIATRTDGSAEIIEEGVSGVLVPIEDHDSLARVIIQMIDDEPFRRSLSVKGQTRAISEFSLERMVVETEELYSRVLAERRT